MSNDTIDRRDDNDDTEDFDTGRKCEHCGKPLNQDTISKERFEGGHRLCRGCTRKINEIKKLKREENKRIAQSITALHKHKQQQFRRIWLDINTQGNLLHTRVDWSDEEKDVEIT